MRHESESSSLAAIKTPISQEAPDQQLQVQSILQ